MPSGDSRLRRPADRPLILLHGAMGAMESCFGRPLPTPAETRRVVAVELQGHGHTGDLDRPLSCEQMADDTAALLRALGIEVTDFVGWVGRCSYRWDTDIRCPCPRRACIYDVVRN